MVAGGFFLAVQLNGRFHGARANWLTAFNDFGGNVATIQWTGYGRDAREWSCCSSLPDFICECRDGAEQDIRTRLNV